MLTEKDYCDYETCVALVDLGMRITSRKGYSDRNTLKHSSRGITYTVRTASAMGWVIAIPLYEAQKWLREEKNIVVRIIPLYEEGKAIKGMSYTNEVIHWDDGYVAEECIEEYDSYEEALLEGLRQAIKILKEK